MAYSLRISSPIRLPGVQRTNGDPDVTIKYGRVDSEECSRSDRIRFAYDEVGLFEISNGERVVVDLEREISDAALRPYIMGPVFGAVLHQRGYLILHASSVSISDTAVAFLGPSGAGKSTIAAACITRGHEVLCDDITAVEFRDGTPVVAPGFPALKLTAELADEFGIGNECLPLCSGDKELYRVPSGVSGSARPLSRIYVLTDGNLQIEEMSPSESMQALIGHTYTQSLLDDVSIKSHFRQCTCVAENTKINWISFPRNPNSLSDAVRRIENEVG